MNDESIPTLNHFAYFSFTDGYWSLGSDARAALHTSWLAALRGAAEKVEVYQSYPADNAADILVWSTVRVTESCSAAKFFEAYARATNPSRAHLRPATSLWGFTRPSQYSKAKSAQEMDPFEDNRKPYLIVYPFVKTIDWYLMSREARQGMMNEHIRIGKQYDDISQLLLYSFGLQEQEFVVVYETEDIRRFSDLVNELRSAEGRRYTLRDTPLHTAIYHPAEETLALWR